MILMPIKVVQNCHHASCNCEMVSWWDLVVCLQEYTVILLSTDELNSSMHMILKDPKWANRVIYMRGSALKAADLKRCR